MTKRVEYLKAQLEEISDEGIFYERAKLLLEAENEGKNYSNGKKYVLCFSHLLENISVEIKEQELIVGMCKEEVLSSEQEKEYLKLCHRYNFKATELFTFDPLKIIKITDEDDRFAPEWFNSYGHCIPDWSRVLEKGFSGIFEEATEKLQENSLTSDEREFLENAQTACQAMNNFVGRYAQCAWDKAQEEQGSKKEQLMEIYLVCSQLSHGGATSFREALQLLWFCMLVLQAICGARDYAFGRLDQILYPYYEKDMKKQILTWESALELMECLFIKTNEIIGYSWEAYRPKRVLCVNSLQYILISGMNSDGSDTTNAISWMILEAVYQLKLKQPTVNIRYHTNINRAFFERACEIAASGLGYPSFFNDHVVIQSLVNNEVDRKEAYNYGYYGCNNSFLPGHEDELREAWHCGPKYLEYALNSGACMMTGCVQGEITPSAYKLKDMEDIYTSLRRQFAYGLRKTKRHVEQSDRYWNEMKPFSFESVLMSDCIRKASSMNDKGSLQTHINNHFVGIATVANSLYAINKLVFEEKRFTLPELVELLKSNWDGEEYIRNYVKEHFPKFGNDEDQVDQIACRVANIFVEEVQKSSPADGQRKMYPSFYSLWHHREFGKKCAASADGRTAGEDISESQSPVYGTEANGPTAMFNSVAKLPLVQTPSGGLNVKFQPRLFKGEKGYLNLCALLEGYFKKGGMHAQINVVGRETLEKAVEHPENYRNLLVRVVGYSAYFISLSPEQQKEMIDRTEL